MHILHEGTKVKAVSFDEEPNQLITLEGAFVVMVKGQMSLVPWIKHFSSGDTLYINCAKCVMIVPKGDDEASRVVGKQLVS